MLPGNPGMIVHGITSSKSIGRVHTQKRVGSNLALTLSALRPTAAKRMAVQDALQKLWLHGKFGGLWAREQPNAWALWQDRHAWYEHVDCREAPQGCWRSANKRHSEGAAGQDTPNFENQKDANLRKYFAPV